MPGVNEVEMTPKKEGTTDAVSLAPQNSAAATSATATPVATPPEKNSTVGKWRKIVENVTESYAVVAVMSVLTMWAMFNDDIRLVATTKEADDSFEAIISVAFFLFVLEIFAQSFYKADYLNWPEWTQQPDETYFAAVLRRMQFGSFYFWLDWIATASLLFEVSDRSTVSLHFRYLFSFCCTIYSFCIITKVKSSPLFYYFVFFITHTPIN